MRGIIPHSLAFVDILSKEKALLKYQRSGFTFWDGETLITPQCIRLRSPQKSVSDPAYSPASLPGLIF